MKWAENPILLWLIAEADFRAEGLPAASWWNVRLGVFHEVLDVCRWLDAEDEWIDDLPESIPLIECGPIVDAWHNWRCARMAEAGVL